MGQCQRSTREEKEAQRKVGQEEKGEEDGRKRPREGGGGVIWETEGAEREAQEGSRGGEARGGRRSRGKPKREGGEVKRLKEAV